MLCIIDNSATPQHLASPCAHHTSAQHLHKSVLDTLGTDLLLLCYHGLFFCATSRIGQCLKFVVLVPIDSFSADTKVSKKVISSFCPFLGPYKTLTLASIQNLLGLHTHTQVSGIMLQPHFEKYLLHSGRTNNLCLIHSHE